VVIDRDDSPRGVQMNAHPTVLHGNALHELPAPEMKTARAVALSALAKLGRTRLVKAHLASEEREGMLLQEGCRVSPGISWRRRSRQNLAGSVELGREGIAEAGHETIAHAPEGRAPVSRRSRLASRRGGEGEGDQRESEPTGPRNPRPHNGTIDGGVREQPAKLTDSA
jgi:hypothetical protein